MSRLFRPAVPFNAVQQAKTGAVSLTYPAYSRLVSHIRTYGGNTRRAACPPLPVFARAASRLHLRRVKIPLTPTRARRAPLFIGFYVLYHNPKSRCTPPFGLYSGRKEEVKKN